MRTDAEKGRARHRDIEQRSVRNEPACPAAERPGRALVVLVAPEPQATMFRDVDQERVHDRGTLLGACPSDLSDSIARLVERRATAGQSIGQLVTFAYRLPRPRGRAAIRRAREAADHILTCYGDHLDAHAAAAQWRTRGVSPLETVFGATEPADRELVVSVIERLEADQADAFVASVLADLAAGVTYRDRSAA